eukprot:11212618-Lingulodinium_polyedra.AAC.1
MGWPGMVPPGARGSREVLGFGHPLRPFAPGPLPLHLQRQDATRGECPRGSGGVHGGTERQPVAPCQRAQASFEALVLMGRRRPVA